MDKNRQEIAIKQAIDKLHNKVIPPRSNVGVGIAIAIDILVELIPVKEKQIEDAYKKGWEEAKSQAIKYVENYTTRLQNETN